MSEAASSYALAVDVGGTKIEAALVTAAGEVVQASRSRVPTGRAITQAGLEQAATDAATRALAHLDPGARVVGVGVGSAGPLDLQRGVVAPVNMPDAAGAGFAHLEAVASAPVALALDGTCIALAEHRFGAARGARNALALVVSTGVGGGLIIDGQPVRGKSGNAGHVGQVRIEPRGDGAIDAGTVEQIASGPHIVRWAQSQGWEGATGEDLARDAAAGLPVARAAVERSAFAVGTAIANVSTLLDLDVAVIAGGFSGVSPDYIPLVAAAVREQAMLPYAATVEVRPSGLDGAGPLVGAAVLAFDGLA
ncbi:ROK family protein [Microbacterium dauci]|uniref:ROK family protein n=1 Tax=Microbacterium dauci TaxID=3048008 RepID=A0ABT6ZD94_9MICO|nr:ROK family protein [Microbacterium sp. LX3-4]MDJ1114131.1 ROK family protein [Microbacterium sp. LX3-4]